MPISFCRDFKTGEEVSRESMNKAAAMISDADLNIRADAAEVLDAVMNGLRKSLFHKWSDRLGNLHK